MLVYCKPIETNLKGASTHCAMAENENVRETTVPTEVALVFIKRIKLNYHSDMTISPIFQCRKKEGIST